MSGRGGETPKDVEKTFEPGMCMKTKKHATNCPGNMRTKVPSLLAFSEKRNHRGLLPHQMTAYFHFHQHQSKKASLANRGRIDGIAMQRWACFAFICVGLNPSPCTRSARKAGVRAPRPKALGGGGPPPR